MLGEHIAQTAGENIAELRRAHGWSQSELAAKCGVAQPTVSGWENGKGMELRMLAVVAHALGTQPHVLVRPREMAAAL